MKRLIAVFLAVCILFSLGGCSGSGNGTKYVCVDIQGEVYQKPSGEWIYLGTGGKGSMQLRIELNMTWKRDGEYIEIQTEFLDNTYEGTLIEDVLTLQVDEQTYIFVPEDMEDDYYKKQEISVVTEPTESQTVDASLVGHYVCQQVTDDDGQADYSNEEWMDLLEDGTCTVCTYAKVFGTWYKEDETITINLKTSEVLTGTLKDGTITIDMDSKQYTFARDDSAQPEAIPHSTEQRGLLQVGSRWKGTVSLEKHKGKGDMEEGEFNVVAQIKEEKGKIYFEAYYESDQNGRPILRFPMTLHPRYILPEIEDDSQDAWLYDVYLTSEDIYTFTMIIDTENKLRADYEDFENEDNRFKNIIFRFEPDE